MKHLLFKTVLASFLVSFSTNTFAWGATGHRIVAQIAELNLTEQAKSNISKLIGNQHLAYYTNWPDEIKSDTTDKWKATFKCHYINFPAGMTEKQVEDSLDNYGTSSAYSALIDNEKVLKDTAANKQEKVIAFKFLLHLLGDIAQPMHVSHENDLGGNKVTVKWFNAYTNLHSLWDNKLISFQGYSYTEYADILNRLPKDESLSSGDLKYWIWDTYANAEYIYKDINHYSKADYKYVYYHKDLLEKQLLKGGLRLAKVLNDIFK